MPNTEKVFIRKPAVAGQFYPGDKQKLQAAIASLIKDNAEQGVVKSRIKGMVLPHAGYQYSGAVAAKTVSSSQLKSTMIILGPNHTGMGEPFSVMKEGRWQTPLGDVDIDSGLALKIIERSSYFAADTLAHRMEHSIEVLIPFLQYVQKDFKIVPIVVARADGKIYKTLAQDIYGAITDFGVEDKVLIVASSDMTHYESQESANKKDHYAIEAIIRLDTEALLERVKEKDITMCGVAPVAIMLDVAKKLGARDATLVKYATSGDVTGDYSSVVGYAGIKVS